ncbi:MAG TPA: XRE family transcriptional regulator [Lentisphaeria bacterium]|nr:XRE family transcriptional regulator [Lentisphaeria bacterium]HCG51100.1 XRE family transcriptional regulator [Lentisphaeria bacterium]
MAVSYNKLWKLLIDKNMKKKELGEAAGISNSLIAKLGKNENVTVDVLVRICSALGCSIDDIMELVPNDRQAM